MHHVTIKVLFHLFVATTFRSSSFTVSGDQVCCSERFKDFVIEALEFAGTTERKDFQGGELSGGKKLRGWKDMRIRGGRKTEVRESSAEDENKERDRSNEIMSKYFKAQSRTGQSGSESSRWKRGEMSVRKLAELLHTLKTMEHNGNGLPPLQSLRFG